MLQQESSSLFQAFGTVTEKERCCKLEVGVLMMMFCSKQIRYNARSYFNMSSKADISQLNLLLGA